MKLEVVGRWIGEGGIDQDNKKQILAGLHAEVVAGTILGYPPNPVLGERPPEVSSSERSLLRSARSGLAQHRSGYSTMLHSYKSRIDPNIVNRCPDCNVEGHTTNHLFNCEYKPTELTTMSLWTDPVGVAGFLGLEADGAMERSQP